MRKGVIEENEITHRILLFSELLISILVEVIHENQNFYEQQDIEN